MEELAMKEDLLKGLTEEQIAKLRKCKSTEEIIKFAKEEGIELNDEQLEAVSGGECQGDIDLSMTCPNCGAWEECRAEGDHYHCLSCGLIFGHRNVD